jgi:hypothetical protein
MRQERTVQATIFEVFTGHQIGCELKAISGWLDGQRALVSLVANDLRRERVHQTGRRGLPAETVPDYRPAATFFGSGGDIDLLAATWLKPQPKPRITFLGGCAFTCLRH